MGMAASQARFLGLTARKSNVEFEGQQINQQRTTLSNESANYYNDLLGMSVPTPPSIDSFTKTVYTFNDGALTNEITSLIAQSNGTYTLSYLSKWQEDYVPVAASTSVVNVQNGNYYVGANSLRTLGSIPGGTTVSNNISIDGTSYPVNQDDGGYYVEKTNSVKTIVPLTQDEINNLEYCLFTDDTFTSGVLAYKDDTTGGFYTIDQDGNRTDLAGVTEDDAHMLIYLFDENETDPQKATTIVYKNDDGTYGKDGEIQETVKEYLTDDQIAGITHYVSAEDYPEFAGMSESEVAKILKEEQAWAQMLEARYGTPSDQWFVRYSQNTTTKQNVPYFYQKPELEKGAQTLDENGNILSNINCYTIGSAQKAEEIKAIDGCMVERDTSGRFISINIPNQFDEDGKVIGYTEYALTTSTVTDHDAYDDAMNAYEYEKYLYDQAIDQINAKIEIIQSEDKNLELRLKQLDTEQEAIQTEIDAVSKVIEKNTESSFKTFG